MFCTDLLLDVNWIDDHRIYKTLVFDARPFLTMNILYQLPSIFWIFRNSIYAKKPRDKYFTANISGFWMNGHRHNIPMNIVVTIHCLCPPVLFFYSLKFPVIN